ncbi:MAG TPA: hypothetical protein VK425_09690 [Acidimicrobiales bacterium]|nr:hypothetical protein [Acidimicrobiales bacterium]
MPKIKISATVDPARLERAKALTGSDNVSEVVDRGLQALIQDELERVHVAGYECIPQSDETVHRADPSVWRDLPWDDE